MPPNFLETFKPLLRLALEPEPVLQRPRPRLDPHPCADPVLGGSPEPITHEAEQPEYGRLLPDLQRAGDELEGAGHPFQLDHHWGPLQTFAVPENQQQS